MAKKVKIPVSIPVAKENTIVAGTAGLGGRTAGLAKAHAMGGGNGGGKLAVAKHKNAVDKFHDFRMGEAQRVDRKREMDHQVRMEQLRIKRVKYEYKQKSAEAERDFRLKQSEADRATRVEELKLQLELEHLRAHLPAAPMLSTAQNTTAKPIVHSSVTPISRSASITVQDVATTSYTPGIHDSFSSSFQSGSTSSKDYSLYSQSPFLSEASSPEGNLYDVYNTQPLDSTSDDIYA